MLSLTYSYHNKKLPYLIFLNVFWIHRNQLIELQRKVLRIQLLKKLLVTKFSLKHEVDCYLFNLIVNVLFLQQRFGFFRQYLKLSRCLQNTFAIKSKDKSNTRISPVIL